jgi:predicted nucleic acid-binding protein
MRADKTASAFLDANVLLYSISTATAEAAKRRRALELLETGDCALSVQVLQELYIQGQGLR